jgi:hypothetical protein
LRGAESIILSAGSAETILLSAGGTESMMLSACTESMIVSAPPTASSSSQHSLIVILCYTITLTAVQWGAMKKITIGNTDNCRLKTLVNSVSTVPPIGLPPKMAKFCHTSNRLLVGP